MTPSQRAAIDDYTERLQRPMTQIEQDAIAEDVAVIEKRDAWLAMWRAELPPISRWLYGIPE